MITKNLKLFLIAFVVSIPLWWATHELSTFFFQRELRANQEFIAALAAQRELEQKLLDAYPLAKKGTEKIDLRARSVLALYVKENGKTKVLFEKDSKIPLPIASISKLMTALVAVKNYPPEQRITITPEILETSGDAGQLREGDVLTVKDLLYLSLMESSNDAIAALVEQLGEERFVALMNTETVRLNLSDTSFSNPTGLDDPRQNNFSTTSDLAAFTRYLLDNYPQIFDILGQNELPLYTSDGMFHHMIRNTNELLGYPHWPTKTLGGKTGVTIQAQETFLFVVESPDERGYIINVILGSQDRFSEMRQLLQWILQSYQWSR